MKAFSIGFLALAIACGCGPDPVRTAALLKQIDRIEIPIADSINSQPVQGGADQRDALANKRMGLVRELYHLNPNDSHLPKLLVQGWEQTPIMMDGVRDAQSYASDSHAAIQEAAKYFLAKRALQFPKQMGRDKSEDPLAYAKRAFLTNYPHSPFAPDLLYTTMRAYRGGPGQKAKLDQISHEILTTYPTFDDWYVVKDVYEGQSKAPAAAPNLQMHFKDAVSGADVTTAGKVVILDGWATYCASCIANIPDLKRLYDDYKGKGLMIVGVSMDDRTTGGLTTARRFVEENGCDWPQFYEGGYRSFCSRWSLVGGTVCVFDRQGRMVARNPHPEDLEPLIRRLLN